MFQFVMADETSSEEKVIKLSVNITAKGIENENNETEIEVKIFNEQNSYDLTFNKDVDSTNTYDFYGIKKLTCSTKNIENLTGEFITYCKDYRVDCQDNDNIPFKYKYFGLLENYGNISENLDECNSDSKELMNNNTALSEKYFMCNSDLIISRDNECMTDDTTTDYDYLYAFIIGCAVGAFVTYQILNRKKTPETGPNKTFQRQTFTPPIPPRN